MQSSIVSFWLLRRSRVRPTVPEKERTRSQTDGGKLGRDLASGS